MTGKIYCAADLNVPTTARVYFVRMSCRALVSARLFLHCTRRLGATKVRDRSRGTISTWSNPTMLKMIQYIFGRRHACFARSEEKARYRGMLAKIWAASSSDFSAVTATMAFQNRFGSLPLLNRSCHLYGFRTLPTVAAVGASCFRPWQ